MAQVRGSTIVEALVAMVIISLAFTLGISILLTTNRSTITVDVPIAISRVEQLAKDTLDPFERDRDSLQTVGQLIIYRSMQPCAMNTAYQVVTYRVRTSQQTLVYSCTTLQPIKLLQPF